MRPLGSQLGRLFVFLIYLAILFAINFIAFDRILPSPDAKGLWFYAGLAALILGSLLVTPYFTSPANALSYTVAALLSVWATTPTQADLLSTYSSRDLVVTYCLVVISICLLAILLQEETPGFRRRLSNSLRLVADYAGTPRVLFTIVLVYSLYEFHLGSTTEVFLIALAGLLIAGGPIEHLFKLASSIVNAWSNSVPVNSVGRIERVDDPNIVRTVLSSSDLWKRDKVHLACLTDGTVRYLLPQFVQIRETELLGTGLLCLDANAGNRKLERNTVYSCDGDIEYSTLIDTLSGLPGKSSLVGFVVENSQIAAIKFELSTDASIDEGHLVFCRQRGQIVYYQVLDAKTTEESFGSNPRGTLIVSAAQLGTFDADGKLKKFGWLPEMNSPVFLSTQRVGLQAEKIDSDMQIGTIPGSDIAVNLNFSDLLHYHCAILGVTGTGKTELTFDVIREAHRRNAKIFCVDFTGDYIQRLADLNPEEMGFTDDQEEELDEKLFGLETGKFGAPDEKKALKDFLEGVEPQITKQVEDFLNSDGAGLAIFQLREIANTRATLKATELYLSHIFRWARHHRRKRDILLVLEEAHTIVPEMNLYRYDKAETESVVGRISQIALQGRKYGVGILLVSQRTALVSKTVLSQCNTFITFSLSDKTSLDFLSNVYSQEHVNAIPNLKFLEAIIAGKAVRSERPILVELPFDAEKKEQEETLHVKDNDKLAANS